VWSLSSPTAPALARLIFGARSLWRLNFEKVAEDLQLSPASSRNSCYATSWYLSFINVRKARTGNMGTGKKEANRKLRQGKTGDGMQNVKVKGENFYR